MGDFEKRVALEARMLTQSMGLRLAASSTSPGLTPLAAALRDGPTDTFAEALLALLEESASRQRPAARPNPVERVRQGDPAEYDSTAQARVWSGSTCSAASLTAVLRSRGAPVRIADVMAAMPGGMTPELGLISRPALTKAAAHFGLNVRDDVTGYQALQDATAAGQPVLVDVTNARFPEGHWLVVTQADARGVRVADSSGYDLQSMTQDDFLASWRGRGMRVLPPSTPAPSRVDGMWDPRRVVL